MLIMKNIKYLKISVDNVEDIVFINYYFQINL